MPGFVQPVEQKQRNACRREDSGRRTDEETQVPDHLIGYGTVGCVPWKGDQVQDRAADHQKRPALLHVLLDVGQVFLADER